MKKIFQVVFLPLIFVIISINHVFADIQQTLKQRLQKIGDIEAQFTQRTTSAENILLEEGNGKLWLSYPIAFHWHQQKPEESKIISDGKTLWFYQPSIEQVIIQWLESGAGNTPFILLTRHHNKDWEEYSITQKGDVFTLIPKNKAHHIGRFIIKITNNGVLQALMIEEKNGQKSLYSIQSKRVRTINKNKFNFKTPPNTMVDDQR